MRSSLIARLLVLMTASLVASGANAATALPAQSSAVAGVTVKATPRTISGSVWEFEIVFDTHTQELKDDLVKSASLVAGGKVLPPAAWQGDPPGGHHRKGVLKFNAADPRPRDIELRLTRPGEPQARSFRWQLD